MTKLKNNGKFPEWKTLGYSQSQQEVIERLDKSYKAFFNWVKRRSGGRKSPPKFRPFRKAKSFTLKQTGWKLDEENGRVLIGKIWFRYNVSRKIQGIPKTLTVKRDAVGDWYICISCKLGDRYKPEKITPTTGKSAGFDFGLKTFLTSSDGEYLQSEQFLKTEIGELRKISRNHSRKRGGSKNRAKSRKSLARFHRRISNKRIDAHFKMALNLVRNYDNLFFETLNLKGMQMLWGRKISDLGFSIFMRILEFKALEHGKTLYKIDRFFPSSKICSKCGEIKNKEELTLEDRIYKCDCGFEADRDLNAAINILREGASSLGLDAVIPELTQVRVA